MTPTMKKKRQALDDNITVIIAAIREISDMTWTKPDRAHLRRQLRSFFETTPGEDKLIATEIEQRLGQCPHKRNRSHVADMLDDLAREANFPLFSEDCECDCELCIESEAAP